MRIFRADATTGHAITQYGSTNLSIAGIVRTAGALQIGRMEFAPGGLCGWHEADVPQLFVVVAGSGWVRGAGGQRHSIAPGQAAYWAAGEGHESGSDAGMVAIVIEGDVLAPDQHMREETPND